MCKVLVSRVLVEVTDRTASKSDPTEYWTGISDFKLTGTLLTRSCKLLRPNSRQWGFRVPIFARDPVIVVNSK
jgi:hypothetical protein